MAISITNAEALDRCNTAVDKIDVSGPGEIVFYEGTPPATAQDSLGGGNNDLCTVVFAAQAFGDAAMDGSGDYAKALVTGTPSAAANATGGITFYRVYDGAALTLRQGLTSLPVGGGDLELSTLTIDSIGQVVTIQDFEYREYIEYSPA